MSPQLHPTIRPLDLESALLLHSAAFPSADSFEAYIRSLPRPKKKRARHRPHANAAGKYTVSSGLSALATSTEILPPDPRFQILHRTIHAPDDLREFVQTLRLGEYSEDPLRRYLCPWHDFEPPTVTLVSQAGRSTLVHCHQCGYRLTPAGMLVSMFGIANAVVFAEIIWPQPELDGDFVDVEVVRID